MIKISLRLPIEIPRGCRGIFLCLLFVSTIHLYGDIPPSGAVLAASGERYSITERSSFRQRLNGRYQGFVYHEVRGALIRNSAADPVYRGSFYVLESLTRDLRNVARRMENQVQVEMRIAPDGSMQLPQESDYPLLRDFPRLPAEPVAVGQRWRSSGVRIVNPLRREGTAVPFLCEYEYRGIGDYNGAPAHIIKAQYAVRYRQGEDPYGDFELTALQGRHLVDIYLPLEGDRTAFMRDVVDEQYQYADGTRLERSGFILTWYEDIEPLNRGGLKDEIRRLVEEEELEDVDVEEREEGIAVRLRNLRFYPDSPELLPGELGKLSTLAQVLKSVGERGILVTGHTAAVGSVESQLELSIERAKRIVELLTAEGIAAERFLYQGLGGSQPIAPNTTEAGRAQNRRVEITILED